MKVLVPLAPHPSPLPARRERGFIVTAMRRLVVVVLAVTAVSCDCGKTPGLMMNNPVAHLETDSLDFGAVTEFTDKQLPLPVRNLGRVSLSAPCNVTF